MGKRNKVTLMNILGKKMEVEDKRSLILFDKWYEIANSLDEPYRSELNNLIEEAKQEPAKKVQVAKYIAKLNKRGK